MERGFDAKNLYALRGGLAAWGAAGYAMESGPSAEPEALTSPDQIDRVGPAEARALADRGDAVIYDVRSQASYDEKHVEGALALPEEDLESLVATVPKDKHLILYCV